MGAHVIMVSCVAIVAIVVPGAMCVMFFVVYIHLWYQRAMGNGIFIAIISVASVEMTSIIVCCADVIIGFTCM